MRLAIVSTLSFDHWGGSEELWSATALEALGQGHTVGVFANPKAETLPRTKAVKEAGAAYFSRHYTPSARLDRALSVALFARGVIRFRPEAVCISQGGSLDFLRSKKTRSLLAGLRKRGIPYVILCHSTDETLQPGRGQAEYAREVFGGAFRVVTFARRGVEIIERQLTASLGNAVVLRNPVNIQERSVVAWPEDGGPMRLAVVARLDGYIKGLDLLVEALHVPAWRERDWRLDIFGDGGSREYLERLVAFYGLGERVKFAGHANDIRAVWAGHHLMVLPSRTENLPLSMVEAMLCGRPCVATDVGGIREWLVDGETGFIAEAGHVGRIRGALERAWLARGRWEAMGKKAHETAAGLVDPNPGKTLLDLLVQAGSAKKKV